MPEFDVIVIGAGGAGMMCAMEAAKRGRKVCLLDHSTKIGRKILISGGGRCNFTNIHATAENYLSKNPHFVKSALSRYTPDDFIKLVRKHRISYHEKKLGQLFCDGSAKSIVDLLVDECTESGAVFHNGTAVSKVERREEKFVATVGGQEYHCESLVIATGGLSIPQIGATSFGYDIARQFGHSIVQVAPALVGLHLGYEDLQNFQELRGVAVDSVVSCSDASFRENILFTHTGLSGPAILQASLYWSKGQALSINLVPDVKDVFGHLQKLKQDNAKSFLKNVLDVLPKRFAETYTSYHVLSVPLAHVPDKTLQEFAEQLTNWQIVPMDSVGYGKAEVTRGGVDTAELSSKTMESRRVKGLYFIGEVVDVTGQLGGFNFQWAWASGHAAGQVV